MTIKNYIEYYFDKDNLPSIKEGILTCKDTLKKNKVKIDKFFKNRDLYNDEDLAKYLNLDMDETKRLLKVYARLELGNKILKCVKEHNECHFEAEC